MLYRDQERVIALGTEDNGQHRLPIFYGWIVVAVAFVTLAIGVNTRTTFSLLFPPILTEFGWDRGSTAAAFSFGFLGSTVYAPLIGILMDRFGPRFAMGPSFSQARTDLSISVADQLERVSPETKIVVEQNLNDINRALDQINAALSGDPDNNLLQQLLMSTYTEELVVLSEIDALTRSVREGVEI